MPVPSEGLAIGGSCGQWPNDFNGASADIRGHPRLDPAMASLRSWPTHRFQVIAGENHRTQGSPEPDHTHHHREQTYQ
jgi:hypothetical protein